MPLAYNQIGIIGASIASFVILAMGVMFFAMRGRVPFTFSRRHISEVVGEYEKYGELYVPPDKQPTLLALDIMMRCLLVTGLPSKAKVTPNPIPSHFSVLLPVSTYPQSQSFEMASVMENGAPRLSLDLQRPISFTPSEQANIFLTQDVPVIGGAETQLSQQALGAERRLVDSMREATAKLKARREIAEQQVNAERPAKRPASIQACRSVQEDVPVDPMSVAFGSGRAMVQLYPSPMSTLDSQPSGSA